MLAVELFPERNCKTCTDRQKKEWGCEGKATLPIVLDGEEQFTCIRRPILENPGWFSEILTMYRAYKEGHLPNEGSILAQPLGVMNAINVIDAAVMECNSVRQDRLKSEKAHINKSGLHGKPSNVRGNPNNQGNRPSVKKP